MTPTVVKKQATLLPNRGVLQALAKGAPNMNDYAKATPTNLTNTVSPVVQMLRVRRGR